MGQLLEIEKLDSDNFELLLHEHDSVLLEHYLGNNSEWRVNWQNRPELVCYSLIAAFESAIRRNGSRHWDTNEEEEEAEEKTDQTEDLVLSTTLASTIWKGAKKQAFGELVLAISDSLPKCLVSEKV